MRTIVFASTNQGKIRELRSLLADLPIVVKTLADYPEMAEIIEDGDSFIANALLKAQGTAAHTGHLALADDSGLEVDALGGAPGIYSARYAGAHGNDFANNEKLLTALAMVAEPDRGAQFHCAVALVWPEGQSMTSEGICRGQIAFAPQGAGGFGYDPLFYLPAYDKTMSELSMEEKNAISHRGQAFAQIKDHLKTLCQA